MKLWREHNTVITAENVKISGETMNLTGQKYKDVSYREIFESGPQYVDWVIWIATLDSDATVELKQMSSFFTAAKDCRLLCRSNESALASDSPNAFGSTTQPRGPASFKKKSTTWREHRTRWSVRQLEEWAQLPGLQSLSYVRSSIIKEVRS